MPELLPSISERRARRAFDSRPVPAELQELLWKAASVAPSHGNIQPTRILVAESSAARERLIQALSPGNRHWAPAAPLLFALVALPEHENPQVNSDGTERYVWPFNAGIVAGNLMVQGTHLGLTTHPMAGFDEPAVRRAFGAPDSVRVLAVFAVGFPGSPESLPEDLQVKEAMAQERLPLERIVGTDSWDEELGVSARDWRKRQEQSM